MAKQPKLLINNPPARDKTLLDELAGLAMQSLILKRDLSGFGEPGPVAKTSYDYAEEMLKEKRRREKGVVVLKAEKAPTEEPTE